MRALRLTQPGQIDLIELDEPGSPVEGETLVRVLRTGICGTDLHAYQGRQPFFTYPRILGHELAVEVLRPSGDLREGDVCCVEPFFNCGKCQACARGKTNCCESLKVYGVHIDGGMRERALIPTHKLHKTKGLAPEQLAAIEPLCIGSHAFWRAGLEKPESVLVIGGGPIGLAVIAAARAEGFEPVLMEVSPVRTRIARERLHLNVVSSPDQLAERPRAIFDCTGNPKSMMATFEMLAHGGQIVFVGLFLGDVVFYNPNFHARETTLKSSRNATAADFKRVISYLERGIVDVRPWFAGVTAPADVAASYATWLDPEAGIIKPMISWEV